MFYLDDLETKPKCKGFTGVKTYSKYLAGQIHYMEENPHYISKIFDDVYIE